MPEFNAWVLDPTAGGAIGFAGRTYNLVKDVVVLLVLFGVGTFIRFRLVDKIKRLAYGWHAWVVLGVIATMMISDVVYDAGHLLSVAITQNPGAPRELLNQLAWEHGDILGGLLGNLLSTLGVEGEGTAETMIDRFTFNF